MVQYTDKRYSMTDQEDLGSSGDGSLVSKQEKQRLSALANDAVKKGAAAMGDAELGKTEKFLGFNVDSGLAAYLSSIYNIASDNIGRVLAPKTYALTQKVGQEMGMAAGSLPLKQTAAVTTFLVTVGLKSAADIGKITTAFSEQKAERKKLVHEISPVLDDVKGRHSLGAFASVTARDNEVIWAHRQRLSRIAKSQNTNRVLGMLMNVIPNVALDITHFNKMWAGVTPDKIKLAADAAAAAKTASSGADDASFGNLGRTFVQATTGQVADRISKSNDLKLRKGLQPYSALEMILELQKQVESNPKSSSFQVPKGFAGANKHPESYPLEEYLGLLFIQHQREMADLRDDHTEIREALHDDVTAAVKPIAKAIRSGSLSVMSLVRLVGERQIIKNHGRAIADPKDVEALIKSSSAYVHTDLEEFYKNSSTTREEMKKLLGKLEGNDRTIYLSLLPDAVKKDLGVPDKEIKAQHTEAKEKKNQVLGDLTVAAHQQSQSDLKKEGLAKPEIQVIDSAYAAIKRDGLDALNEFKTSPTNPKGIEQVLANWAVPHIQGGKDHLGKMMEKGHIRLEELTSKLDSQADVTRDGDDRHEEPDSHASRQKTRSEASYGASAEME